MEETLVPYLDPFLKKTTRSGIPSPSPIVGNSCSSPHLVRRLVAILTPQPRPQTLCLLAPIASSSGCHTLHLRHPSPGRAEKSTAAQKGLGPKAQSPLARGSQTLSHRSLICSSLGERCRRSSRISLQPLDHVRLPGGTVRLPLLSKLNISLKQSSTPSLAALQFRAFIG